MINDAKWIGLKAGEDSPFLTVPYSREAEQAYIGKIDVESGTLLFRHKFVLAAVPEKAVLRISGLGFYEVYLNGVMPDEKRVLTPIVSDYFKLVRYDTYDVTAHLTAGANTLCAEAAPGWFAGEPKYWGWQQMWYGNPRMTAELEMVYGDGHIERVVTDETWKISHGAITKSSIYDGETTDFNLEQSGWKLAGFDDSAWNPAVTVRAPAARMEESIAPPERIIRINRPQKTWRLSDTVWGYDFGENGAAMPYVVVRGKKGDSVCLQHAEYLNDDGTLNRRSENRAECTDTFILADDQPTVCRVRFTWHGYRYMTVTLSSPDMEIRDVRMQIVHNDVRTVGTFRCGKPEFNHLHEGYLRTQLACLQGVPVDCPQRDERKGWLGDAYATSEMCYYNFDMDALYRSFLEDMNVSRSEDCSCVSFLCPCYNIEATVVEGERSSIDWNMAYPMILWEHYQRYGDPSLLRHHFVPLKEHTDYYVSLCSDGFIPYCWFGDWLSFDYPPGTVNRVAFEQGPDYHRQNPPFAATMFYCTTMRILSQIAKVLSEDADAAYYAEKRKQSIEALQKKYYDAESGIFGGGGQFLQAYALYEHLVPEEDRDKVFARLVDSLEEQNCHLLLGIIGTRVLFDVLNTFGRRDLILRVFSADGYLCPQHMLEEGRTTLPESPDGDGSGCHCMWASPDTSFYKVFGGISVDRSKEVPLSIHPYFVKDVQWVECKQQLTEGEVAVNWRYDGESVVLNLKLPLRASVTLPCNAAEIWEAGEYSLVLTYGV